MAWGPLAHILNWPSIAAVKQSDHQPDRMFREKRDDVEECRLARRVRTDKYLKSVQILLNKPQTSTPERLNSRDHSGSESLSMNAVV